MRETFRFGRRVSLPSTLQIVHDLLVAERDEVGRLPKGSADASSSVDSDAVLKAAVLVVLPQG
jgi:hypothetical protein